MTTSPPPLITSLHRLARLAGMALVLTACGGGGGGGGGASGDPRDWQTAQLLETSAGEASEADVSINFGGVGYAVWEQIDNGRSRIFSRRNRLGPWENIEAVSAASEEATEPQVVSLPDGEALAVWLEAVGVDRKLVAARTVNGQWGPVIAQLDQGDIGDVHLVDDGQGRAMALWRRANAVQASHFVSNAFQPAEQVSIGTTTGQEPAIAMAVDGHALAAWIEDSNVGGVVARRVFVRPFVNGGWRGVTALADTFADDAISLTVAVAPDGRGVVAWQQNQGNSVDVLARIAVDTRDGLWSGVGILCTGVCRSPQATMDPFGRATVVLAQSSARVDVFASHFNGSRWLAPANIETHSAGDATSPKVVCDALGRVVAVWRESNGEPGNPSTRRSLLSNRFDPAEGTWATPEPVETDDSGSVSTPSLAMNAAGRALAVWDFSVPANPTAILSVMGNALQ